MIGRSGVAPCGHRGEYLTVNYVRCLEGCDKAGAGSESDGVPEVVGGEGTEPETEALCRICGSDNVDVFPGLWVTGEDLVACYSCGAKYRGAKRP